MSTREYAGDAITVLWDSERCIHSGHCARTLGSVFRPDERPWIDVKGASADEIRRTIDGCPSGALGYLMADQNQATDPSEPEVEVQPLTVTLHENGPLEVVGLVEITDGSRTTFGERTFLCRCGGSANKPFCDGSHRKNGFSDDGNPGLTSG